MKKRGFLLFVFLSALIFQSLYAQSFIVKGQVVSKDDKEPLIGVAIMQEGSTNGVTTDFDGNYTIEVREAEKATLVFSYVGMETQKHVVNAQTHVLNVVMQSNAEIMDEVVVVAYGVRKKGTIAGSVSTVKSDKLESTPTAAFDQALQGQIPGLDIVPNSGNLGSGTTMRLRGTSTINGNAQPLIVVNDHIFELPDDAMQGVDFSNMDNEEQFSTLLNVNTEDIESITVLKDGAAAKWGAKGSNGVIEIKTKRGKSMVTRINIRA